MTTPTDDYTIDRRKMKVDRPELADLTPADIGGNEYGFKWESRCRVCTSGDNVLANVNNALAQGYSYRDVLRLVEPFNVTLDEKKKITYNSIRNHQKRHMPFDSAAVREVLEKRAEAAGKDFVTGQERIVTAAGYAETMMMKGFDTMMKDGTVISANDGMKAALILDSLTTNEDSKAIAEEMFTKLNRIIEAVKKFVSPDQLQQILADLDNENRMIEAEIIED